MNYSESYSECKKKYPLEPGMISIPWKPGEEDVNSNMSFILNMNYSGLALSDIYYIRRHVNYTSEQLLKFVNLGRIKKLNLESFGKLLIKYNLTFDERQAKKEAA